MNGLILWWNVPKQNGIITTEDGTRYYFDVMHIVSGPMHPKYGQKVTFVASSWVPKPGLLPVAVQVRIVDEKMVAGLNGLREAV